MIIDSHAHLDYPQLAGDLPGVLARAREAGVDRVITIGVKLDLNKKQQTTAPHNEVDLANRMAKIPGQRAIALGAQHLARLGFNPAALFKDAPSAGDTVRVGTFLFTGFLRLGFSCFYSARARGHIRCAATGRWCVSPR